MRSVQIALLVFGSLILTAIACTQNHSDLLPTPTPGAGGVLAYEVHRASQLMREAELSSGSEADELERRAEHHGRIAMDIVELEGTRMLTKLIDLLLLASFVPRVKVRLFDFGLPRPQAETSFRWSHEASTTHSFDHLAHVSEC
jgi:hypothetical protein